MIQEIECKFPKWNHILEKEPDYGSTIVYVSGPYERDYDSDYINYYHIGMRVHNPDKTPDELKIHRIGSNVFWMYAKDFPFPCLKS